jgi:electron transfer flavoprotein alpha subunit
MNMDMNDNIWVYSDLVGRYAELAGGAALLGGHAQAIVVGSEGDAAKVAASGVAKVHAMAFTASRIVDDYLSGMVKLIQGSGPSCMVLVAATRRGRLMAARLAARLDAAVVSDVNAISLGEDGLTVTHSVYGGLAQGTEKICAPRAVLLVAAGTFDPAEAAGTAEIVATAAEVADGVTCLGHHPKQGSNVELGRARRVVGVGRGLKSQEDLGMVEALAKVLDAELGCSRPLAEGENWLDHERYVGITGVKLKADVYVALGISGQIQHMAGATACRTIVAVNKDKNAPIFQHADYGLVGDIYKVVPALSKLLGQ